MAKGGDNKEADILYGSLGPRGKEPDHAQLFGKELRDGSKETYDYFEQLLKVELAPGSCYNHGERRFSCDGKITIYFERGKLHCEDGPAVIFSRGQKEWWVNGELHRDNGPAVIYPDGTEEYWLYGHGTSV